MPVIYCPVELWDETIHVGVILVNAAILIYDDKVYDLSHTDLWSWDNISLKQALAEGFHPSIEFNDYVCRERIHGEFINVHYLLVHLQTLKRTIGGEIAYKWQLLRKPNCYLRYHNLEWRILRVQKWLRRTMHDRRSQRRLALAMALHHRLGKDSSLSLLHADVMRFI